MKARFNTPSSTPITVWLRRAGVSAVLGLIPLLSNAQSVATVPVGAMIYTFPATTQVTTTYISIPLTNPAIYTLPVASLTANTLTFSGTPFPAGGLAQVGNPFFARIATGAQAGRTILVTANTTSSITVDTTDNSSQTTGLDTSGWAVAAGDRIEIIVGDTLASVFGDGSVNNPLLFVGAGFSFLADAVSIYNRATGNFDAYHYNTTNGFWRPSLSAVNSNSLVLYPGQVLGITRRSARSSVTLTLVGDVPAVAPLIKTAGSGNVIYASTGYPVDISFSNFVVPGWTKGTFSFLSDVVGVYNPATAKFDAFFQRSDNNQWRVSLDTITDYSSKVLSSGSGFVLVKRAAVSGAGSFIKIPLPYTL